MPRYYYPALVPLIRELAQTHGIEYRSEGEAAILKRNWQTLRTVAHAPAHEGAMPTRSDTVWSRRKGAAWVGSNRARPADMCLRIANTQRLQVCAT